MYYIRILIKLMYIYLNVENCRLDEVSFKFLCLTCILVDTTLNSTVYRWTFIDFPLASHCLVHYFHFSMRRQNFDAMFSLLLLNTFHRWACTTGSFFVSLKYRKFGNVFFWFHWKIYFHFSSEALLRYILKHFHKVFTKQLFIK